MRIDIKLFLRQHLQDTRISVDSISVLITYISEVLFRFSCYNMMLHMMLYRGTFLSVTSVDKDVNIAFYDFFPPRWYVVMMQ